MAFVLVLVALYVVGAPSPLEAPRAAGEGGAAGSPPVDGGSPRDLILPPPTLSGQEPPDEKPAQPGVGLLPLATGTGVATPISAGQAGVPARVFAAYRAAVASLARTDPGCHLAWPLLAAIGQVESGQARGGAVAANGKTRSPILGPVLSGGGGFAAIRDSDGGRYDGSAVWDRAVGPMQFIPSSWRIYGADGNGDGLADPHNVYDAALAAGRYLCAGGQDLSTTAGQRRAVFGYNHSWDYVATVLAWMNAYARGGAGPMGAGPVVTALVGYTPAGGPASAARQADVRAVAASPGPTGTPTPSGSPSPSGTPSSSPTPSTGSGSPTPSPTTSTGSGSPTPSPTTSTGSGSPTPSPTPSSTQCPSPSPTPSATPTPTPTPTPSTTPDPCAASPTPSGSGTTTGSTQTSSPSPGQP